MSERAERGNVKITAHNEVIMKYQGLLLFYIAITKIEKSDVEVIRVM